MNRRNYLKNLALISGGLLLSNNTLGKTFTHLAKAKTLLLVSDWQYWNIGDMTHTTGILNLLNLYLPDVQVILWPRREESRQQDAMLMKNFPDLQIVYGSLKDGKPDSESVLQAAEKADFLLHSSGSGLPGAQQVAWWKDHIKKPYGFYGVSVTSTNDTYRELIRSASFIFTRETQSLKDMKDAGIKCKIMEFVPDSTFATHLHDEKKATQYMQAHGLEYKKFICVIPRLRVTPYFDFAKNRNYSEERIQEINELNNKNKEIDHAKAREAMITWVRQTGNKVLVCPEMVYQIDVMDELLIDPLPQDVKKMVVKRDAYWLCDEASTVYKNATAVLSFECHSPIMAAYNGTPAFYLRQPEDTIKGQMWYDIGLTDWVFEIEQTTGEQIASRLMEVYDDYTKACQQVEASMDYVREVQLNSMLQVRELVWEST